MNACLQNTERMFGPYFSIAFPKCSALIYLIVACCDGCDAKICLAKQKPLIVIAEDGNEINSSDLGSGCLIASNDLLESLQYPKTKRALIQVRAN